MGKKNFSERPERDTIDIYFPVELFSIQGDIDASIYFGR